MESYKNTNNNLKRNRTKIKKSFFNIKEKAAFEMLQQRKSRQITNKEMHQVGTGSVNNDRWRDQKNTDHFFVDL